MDCRAATTSGHMCKNRATVLIYSSNDDEFPVSVCTRHAREFYVGYTFANGEQVTKVVEL